MLKWGIFGAIVMRLIMIALGAFLLHRFNWIIYVFGALLVVTGIRMLTPEGRAGRPGAKPGRAPGSPVHPAEPELRWHQVLHPHGTGKVLATPLLLVLLVVEWSDLVFAIDSIPAIFAVTRDPFLVYSSNVFAILGLRALYFVLAGMLDKFVYLKPGISFILIFVGLKMVLSGWFHVPILLSLGVIVTTLALAVVLSLRHSAREAGAGA